MARFPALALLGALVLASAGLGGCGKSIQQHPRSGVLQANTERDFWSTLVGTVRGAGFLVGAGGVDERERTLTSAWKVDTAPFRSRASAVSRRSLRARVHASYQRIRGTELGEIPEEELPSGGLKADFDTFRVTLRVEREFNDSLRPMDLSAAKWTAADDDAELARRLLFDLGLRLGGTEFELHDDPERRKLLEKVRD
ncbi:MAG: hypothetical protein AAFZ87_10365 [Planctomycetota bacterium]